ncbi:DUF7674 family protein [Streptomyces sp. NBC_01465]|uniref:DUF7674 family protein n=1 Tax=Streptomyces sp. NBC_01465 TaxID=2903878 RepID=UPI002E31EFC2|nr:hypothetical protein [Streptomyces sp. NBC_01465]
MTTSYKQARADRIQQLVRHAAARWPQIADLTVRARGEFVHLEARWAGEEHERPGKLCRLRETAHADFWTFAFRTTCPGRRYQEGALPSGAWTGAPEEIFDYACERHLAGSCPPNEPMGFAYDKVLHALVAEVPELREDLAIHLYNEYELLQHVFMALDVTPFVISAWNQDRTELTNRCMQFIERALTCDDAETRSMVATSFVYQVGPWDPQMAPFIRTWPPALLRSAQLQAPYAQL